MKAYLRLPVGPDNPPLAVLFRLDRRHPLSRYGLGVWVQPNTKTVLDGGRLRLYRSRLGPGVVLECPDPDAACRALGVPAGEPGVVGRG